MQRLGQELGVPVTSPIVPLIIGPEQAAVDASMELLQRGFHVPAIRPPTVPRGTSRLRVSLSAAHSDADLQLLIEAMRSCGMRFQSLPQLPPQQEQGQGLQAAENAVAGAGLAVAGAPPALMAPPHSRL